MYVTDGILTGFSLPALLYLPRIIKSDSVTLDFILDIIFLTFHITNLVLPFSSLQK